MSNYVYTKYVKSHWQFGKYGPGPICALKIGIALQRYVLISQHSNLLLFRISSMNASR